jgi:hypothetical protein
MNGLPTIQDAHGNSINSAVFIIMAFCVIGLLVALTMVQSSSFQPSPEQITLLRGWCGPLLKHTASLADCVAPARAMPDSRIEHGACCINSVAGVQ